VQLGVVIFRAVESFWLFSWSGSNALARVVAVWAVATVDGSHDIQTIYQYLSKRIRLTASDG